MEGGHTASPRCHDYISSAVTVSAVKCGSWLRIVIFMFWRCISILIRPELTGNLIRFSVRVFITQIADHAAEPSAYSFAILTSMYILYIHWLQNSAQTKLANYIPLGWSNMWNTYVSSYLGPCSNCFAILILLVYFIRSTSTLFYVIVQPECTDYPQ